MLAELVPAPMVRLFAGPYVAGESAEAALDSAADNLDAGLLTTLDLLGEDVTSEAQVERNEQVYANLLQAVADDDRFADPTRRPTVSLKPSAFSLEDPASAFVSIDRLVAKANEAQVGLTIDMEDRRWTDITLERAVALFEAGHDVGTVLQTRLNRTEADLDRIPPGMRVRLVIGIYPEPPEVATTDKIEMKERLLDYAARLLERGARVEFGTHDDAYVERFARDLAPKHPDQCEVQMLLGVPRATLQKQLMAGDLGVPIPVRLYVPFAVGWSDATAYLRRRMAESPSIVWLVLRNLFNRDTH